MCLLTTNKHSATDHLPAYIRILMYQVAVDLQMAVVANLSSAMMAKGLCQQMVSLVSHHKYPCTDSYFRNHHIRMIFGTLRKQY